MQIIKSGMLGAAIGLAAFLAGCAVTEVPLKETVWVPCSLDAGVQLSSDGRAWFSINNENRLTGNGGVNRIMGSVSAAEDGKLVFNPPATTRMAGPDLPYETAFLKVLQDTRTYQLSGETLQLFDENGKLLATFKAGQKEQNNSK